MSELQYRRLAFRFSSEQFLWLGPVLYVLIVGMYYVFRYNGFWAESDTSALTHAIRAIANTGRLDPEREFVYPNGYGYQSISTFLLSITGLDVMQLQQLLMPVLACFVVLPAWLLYRELFGSLKGATLATMLLFTQPEFLFVIMRSSHEKFTRALMLFCLYLLVRSINVSDRRRLFITFVGLFYVSAFALIASNTFIAHSFILAVALAFTGGWVLQLRNSALRLHHSQTWRRFPYVFITSIAGVYLFIFYVYPPARHQLDVIGTIWQQMAALIFGADTPPANTYAAVSIGWTSIFVYFLVSAANWILLMGSFAIWLVQGYRWFWKGETPRTPALMLIWLFYAAFAFQGALSILMDVSGAVGNAQQRLFPSIAIFAVAVVAGALTNWQPRRGLMPVRLAMAVAMSVFAMLALAKATNEPVVSNNWVFYRPTEISAIDWADEHLTSAPIWTEYDQRLAVAWDMKRQASRHSNFIYGGQRSFITRTVVLSDVTRYRSSQLHRELQVLPDAAKIYDNGEAEVYHLRPETPYQR
jgi:hypothetical protein